MALSLYTHQRILDYYLAGYKAPTIEKELRGEGIKAGRVGIWKFIKKYQETGTIARREGAGRPTLLTPEVRLIVDQQMLKDDETTAYQVGCSLRGVGHCHSHVLSVAKGYSSRGCHTYSPQHP